MRALGEMMKQAVHAESSRAFNSVDPPRGAGSWIGFEFGLSVSISHLQLWRHMGVQWIESIRGPLGVHLSRSIQPILVHLLESSVSIENTYTTPISPNTQRFLRGAPTSATLTWRKIIIFIHIWISWSLVISVPYGSLGLDSDRPDLLGKLPPCVRLCPGAPVSGDRP